ncbi:MAG: hypothetical protein DRQ39_10840 [Gammaproteobacteria bacterium]|nr:MAG: hypothetical protein DRQ39_10840 [Gammaproteobacteria bacterium]
MIANDKSLTKPSNCYVIKLQQHLIFHQKVIGDPVVYLYDGFNGFKLFEQASCKHLGQAIAFYRSELWLKSTRQIKSRSLRNGGLCFQW